MPTRAEIIEKLASVKTTQGEFYGIRAMALFGSFARNEQTPSSDVDVLVDFEKPISGFAFVRLADTIEKVLGIRADVVPADGVKQRYMEHIKEELCYV